MKTLLLLSIPFWLVCCKTAEQNAKVSGLATLAIIYAESRGVISTSDADLLFKAKKIVLPDEPTQGNTAFPNTGRPQPLVDPNLGK